MVVIVEVLKNVFFNVLFGVLVKKERKFFMGNEVIVYGVFESGVVFVIGYLGIFLIEVIEIIVRLKLEVFVEWVLNEKVVLEEVVGVVYIGLRVFVIMKCLGLNVVVDLFMSFVYFGVEGGFVIFVVDDFGLYMS